MSNEINIKHSTFTRNIATSIAGNKMDYPKLSKEDLSLYLFHIANVTFFALKVLNSKHLFGVDSCVCEVE
jgi:hypothetical protein